VPVALNPVTAALDKWVKLSFQGHAVPDLARLYDLHAEDCIRTAGKIDNPAHRAMLLKAAAEWSKGAQQLRQLQHPPHNNPPARDRPDTQQHTKRPGKGGRSHMYKNEAV
jgi:hypothetical protein